VHPRRIKSEAGQRLAKLVTAPAGTLVVYDGRIWHGNGLNRFGAVRSNISIPHAQPWGHTRENACIRLTGHATAVDFVITLVVEDSTQPSYQTQGERTWL
jgi:hypothetical protein